MLGVRPFVEASVSRAIRLLELMEMLRRHRHPVTGAALAEELGITLRSLYRDIATMRGQGARIIGEPGVGYLLRPGFTLPPLNFTEEEAEALALGGQWVERHTDTALAKAARSALAKIAGALPPERRDEMAISGLHIIPASPAASEGVDLGLVRQAIRGERRLAIQYTDAREALTQRVIWPIALGYFERWRVVAAWCESRQAFRHFRTDRIGAAHILDGRYPRRRSELLREWKAAHIEQRTEDVTLLTKTGHR
jgi:predicted DNA-binding transcriptional regulator YafY